MHVVTNSCGSMHGVVMQDKTFGAHVNSRGAVGHRNSCNSHAAELWERETKALSTSNRCKVGRPAGKLLASLQQVPEKLHVETWAGRSQGPGLRMSQELEIVPGCAVTVTCPSCPFNTPDPPGPRRVIRNMLGWSHEEKKVGSGVWLFRGAVQGENLFSSLSAAGDWVRKGSYHTAWAVPWVPRVLARIRTGGPSYRAAFWRAV